MPTTSLPNNNVQMDVVLARTELSFLRVVTVCWDRLSSYETLVYEQNLDGDWFLLDAPREHYDTEALARGGHETVVERLRREHR